MIGLNAMRALPSGTWPAGLVGRPSGYRGRPRPSTGTGRTCSASRLPRSPRYPRPVGPSGRHPVDHASDVQRGPVGGRNATDEASVEHLAEDVELQLVRGHVPDAPGREFRYPGQEMLEAVLRCVGMATNRRDGMILGCRLVIREVAVCQPVEEGRRLGRQSELKEGVERERCITQPRESIVPVALTADFLGEARGRRRDDRASWRIGHQLQRHRRAGHHLPPKAPVGRAAQPARQKRAVSSARCCSSPGGRRRGWPPIVSSMTPPVWPARSVRIARSPSPWRSTVTPCSRREVPGSPTECTVRSRPSAWKTAPSSDSSSWCALRA